MYAKWKHICIIMIFLTPHRTLTSPAHSPGWTPSQYYCSRWRRRSLCLQGLQWCTTSHPVAETYHSKWQWICPRWKPLCSRAKSKFHCIFCLGFYLFKPIKSNQCFSFFCFIFLVSQFKYISKLPLYIITNLSVSVYKQRLVIYTLVFGGGSCWFFSPTNPFIVTLVWVPRVHIETQSLLPLSSFYALFFKATVLMLACQFYYDWSHSEMFNMCICGLQRSGINSSDVEMLLLTNVTQEDAGEYICKVSNYIGEANQSGWLTVIPGNPWDLWPHYPIPLSPRCGFLGLVPDLLCCGVVFPPVVSWCSWDS